MILAKILFSRATPEARRRYRRQLAGCSAGNLLERCAIQHRAVILTNSPCADSGVAIHMNHKNIFRNILFRTVPALYRPYSRSIIYMVSIRQGRGGGAKKTKKWYCVDQNFQSPMSSPSENRSFGVKFKCLKGCEPRKIQKILMYVKKNAIG